LQLALQQQQMPQQAGHAHHVPASPGLQRQPVAPHLAASAPPLPGVQSPSSVYGQNTISYAYQTATERSANRPAASVMAQTQPFQEGQHVLYHQSESIRIPAEVIKVYTDDGAGGPPYYDVKFLRQDDIPQHVQEHERANWCKQTVATRLSPMEKI